LIYKNITLITNTQIIKQIFTLVCNKLSINLEIYSDDSNISKTDILIYEDIDYKKEDVIRYKSMCTVLAVIAKHKAYEFESAYLIKKPFLPSQLVTYISELVDQVSTFEQLSKVPKIEKENISNTNEFDEFSFELKDDNVDIQTDMSNEVDDLVDFIDTMEEAKDIELDDSEDIIIKKSDLGHGGVLDQKELSNLHNIINDSEITGSSIDEVVEELPNNEDDDWLELNDIIDDVIEDISQEPEVNKNDDILLVLNKFTMDELAPLLNKLDQDIIDKISAGEDVSIKLRLER